MVITDCYPSRVDTRPHILKRLDPVVHSMEPPTHGLTQEQADYFGEHGYLLMPELFSRDEVAALLSELDRLGSDSALDGREERIREPGSGILRSVFAVHRLSPLFGALCRDRRLLDIAEYLLGGQVYIHQSRANLKPGLHGKEFYWHSDFETWHVEDGMPRMRAVSLSLSLTDNLPHNGPLLLIPGSHRRYVACVGATPDNHYRQSLRKQEYGVPDDESLRHLFNAGGITEATGAAGSAVFFDCNIMHGSNSNITPLPRSNVFFVYNSVENRLEAPYGAPAPRPEFIAARAHADPL